MANVLNVKGMLLEEIILFLLNNSGCEPVTVENDDSKLLHDGPSGLELAGRGAKHQIDVIADFSFILPFVNPVRLLIEAKCYNNKPVGLECVRNAFGVLSDVNEHWNIVNDGESNRNSKLIKRRYHYCYAIFSATGFTKEAINYAYVQDIFLFDLSSSIFINDIVEVISNLSGEDFNVNGNKSFNLNIKEFRSSVRSYLKHNIINANNANVENVYEELQNYPEANQRINFAISHCQRISKSYMAILGKRFPVFVTPNPEIDIMHCIKNINEIEIWWDDRRHFYIKNGERELFSFSLPDELFRAYQKNGDLTENDALNMKQKEMPSIQIFMKDENNRLMPISLHLNMEWLTRYRNSRR